MTTLIDFLVPTREEFRKGYEIYNVREKLGPVWFEALATVSNNWDNPTVMARGVQRLIRAWNRFYANFDLDGVAGSIGRNLSLVNDLRARDIGSFACCDVAAVKALFNDFLGALERTNDHKKSPVSVAKAFSLLAPNFLPIWDSNIAFAYHCPYLADSAAIPYINYCSKMKALAAQVAPWVNQPDDRPLLKRIDEYNYSLYTKHWISSGN